VDRSLASEGDIELKILNLRFQLNTIFSLVFFACSALALSGLLRDFLLGGNAWKQGDWLINIDRTLVRRGPLGSAIIRVSDILHTNPLVVVLAIQAVLFLTLVIMTWNVVRRMEHPNAYWLLVLSPAFFTIFWAADTEGSMRKELIIYVSFVVFLTALLSADYKRSLFNLSGALFLVGLISHEANLFFVPIYLYCGLIAARAGRLPNGLARFWLPAVIVTSLFVVYFTLVYSRVEMADDVCLPLLERGLSSKICGGAIAWLTYDLDYAMSKTAAAFSSKKIVLLPVMFLLSSISLLVFAFQTDKRLRTILQLCLLAALFTPLYFIAVDFGRWINFYVSSFVFLVICSVLTDNLRMTKELSAGVLIACIGLALILSPSHTRGFESALETPWNAYMAWQQLGH